ncbi:MAG TPA: isoamylase early set domain-containing protein [Polyangia bacterium]|nr:isoamylase early set domain-containing protein [Polyangia bacterium]
MKRRLELFRRYLDHELELADARELEALLAREGVARAELEAYRSLCERLARLHDATVLEPAPDFAARVMRRLPAAPRRSLVRELLLAPRLSLAAVVGLLALAALVWLPLRPLRTRPQVVTAAHEASVVGVQPSRILVRFVLPAQGARRVALAGDFNGWRVDDIVLTDSHGDGLWSATVPLPPGHHSYLFWVDGKWVQDPAAAASVPDGFGQRNSVLDL